MTAKLPLGALGLGIAPLGNLYTRVSDADAEATLAAAQHYGIAWFDVAPLYGYGLAEERLGRFLERSKPFEPIVSTKVGCLLEPATTLHGHDHFVAPRPFRPVFDYSHAGIERSYEESLRRLGLERVQVLLLHDIDRLTHRAHRAVVKQVLDEALPALHRLKAEGRVDAIGLGVNQWDIGYEMLASADVDCILLAGRYTLLDHSAFSSGFLDACTRRHVSVLVGGVFNSGFLAGGAHYDYHQADEALLKRRDRLVTICHRYGIALAAAALQFTAAHPAISSIVVGARSAQEVDAIVGWTRTKISKELWHELRAADLIPVEAPAPDGA